MTIDEKRNEKGQLIGWKVRVCVGRDGGKQKWKTLTIRADDPDLEDVVGNGKKADKERADILKRKAWEFEKAAKEEFTNQQEIKGKDPDAVTIDKRKITLSQYVRTYWWNDVKKSTPKGKPIRPNTLAFYKYTSDNICDYFDTLPKSQQRLYRMEPRTVKDFLNWLRSDAVGKDGEHFSETTVLRHWQTFRNIINSALRDEYIMRDPCLKFKPTDKPSTPQFDGGYLNDEQARAFIKLLDVYYNKALEKYQNTDPDAKSRNRKKPLKPYYRGEWHRAALWRCMMNLFVQHGLRRGEAIGLKWKDIKAVSIDGKKYYSIDINENITPDATDKKKYHTDDPKTKSSARTILIQPEIYKMLMEVKKMREVDMNITIFPTSKEYVFCRDGSSSTPMYPSEPTRWLSRFAEKHEIIGSDDKYISVHDLRRTWETLANEAGVNLKAIKATIGHSDGADTDFKHYIKLTIKGQIDALNTMHAVFYGEDKGDSQEESKA